MQRLCSRGLPSPRPLLRTIRLASGARGSGSRLGDPDDLRQAGALNSSSPIPNDRPLRQVEEQSAPEKTGGPSQRRRSPAATGSLSRAQLDSDRTQRYDGIRLGLCRVPIQRAEPGRLRADGELPKRKHACDRSVCARRCYASAATRGSSCNWRRRVGRIVRSSDVARRRRAAGQDCARASP